MIDFFPSCKVVKELGKAFATIHAEALLKKSRLLRIRKKDSQWLLKVAVEIAAQQDGINAMRLIDTLYTSLEYRIRKKYGNPIVIWFLLKFVLPIVIRLVINWWFDRLQAKA